MSKQPKPSLEFLSMVIILLRNSHRETGDSLVSWLEHFEEDNSDVDTYDDKQLRLAVSKLRKELYPDDRPPLDPEDYADEEEVPEVEQLDEPDETPPVADAIDDDDEPMPTVEKVE